MKKLKGLLDLIQTGIEKGTTAVEKVHKGIIDNNFAVVKTIPVIDRIAANVHEIQIYHAKGIYSIIRLVNQELGIFAKSLLDGFKKLAEEPPKYMIFNNSACLSIASVESHAEPKYTDSFVSIVNGVIGDFLRKNNNGLELSMEFYHQNHPLCLTREDIKKAFSKTTSKICVMIHGLACNEKTWGFDSDPATTYGALLQKDLDYTPFYIRYNTGLHISENGRNLSALMTNLLKAYPQEIEEVVIIGHSMGGLVARSGCWYGKQEQADWTGRVKKIFYLASPHLGAPLEKFGNLISGVLKKIPTSYTKLASDIIDLRSSGIKDLRFGNMIDEDWSGHDPDVILENNKTPIPLMEGASHYAISGSLTRDSSRCFTRLIGDPMVRKSSAFGRSGLKEQCVDFCGYREFSEVGHIRLAHYHGVYRQIKMWCQQTI